MKIRCCFLQTVTFLVLCSILLSACGASQRTEEPTPTPIPTPVIPVKPTYPVAKGDVVHKLEFNGRVAPVTQEELFFKINGRVAKIFVKEGEQVKAGQILAELETNTSAVDVRRAQINLEVAKLNKEMYLLTANKYAATYPMQIKMKDYDIELAQLALDEIAAKVNTAQIKAPFDGTLLSMSLSVDKVITAYKSEVVLANLSQLEVRADLMAASLTSLEEGLPVQVFPASGPGAALNAFLSRLPYPYGKGQINPQGKPDNATHVTMIDDLAKNRLGLGDLVRVVVILEKKTDALWIPPQAIRKYEGRQYVVVQDSSGQRRVDIKTGVTGDDRVEITEGLSEGQVIVSP